MERKILLLETVRFVEERCRPQLAIEAVRPGVIRTLDRVEGAGGAEMGLRWFACVAQL